MQVGEYRLPPLHPFLDFHLQQMRGKDQGELTNHNVKKGKLELIYHDIVITAMNNKVHNKFDCEYDHIRSKFICQIFHIVKVLSRTLLFL